MRGPCQAIALVSGSPALLATDAIAAVDVKSGDGAWALDEMGRAGAVPAMAGEITA